LKSKLDTTTDQLATDSQKISNALKMTHEDAQMIMELRSDLQKVCSLLEGSKEREDKQRHIILNLKSHIESLTDQLNHMSEEKYGQGNTLKKMLQDRDKIQENLQQAEKQNGDMLDQIKELQSKNKD